MVKRTHREEVENPHKIGAFEWEFSELVPMYRRGV